MLKNNTLIFSVKVVLETLTGVIYFPFWWYTKGLFDVFSSLFEFLKQREKGLGLFIWIRNIFVPMYAQTDWQGRLISFFMRLIQIIIRGALMLVWLAIILFVLALYVVFPVLLLQQILFQIF